MRDLPIDGVDMLLGNYLDKKMKLQVTDDPVMNEEVEAEPVLVSDLEGKADDKVEESDIFPSCVVT